MDFSKCRCKEPGYCPEYCSNVSYENFRWCKTTTKKDRQHRKDLIRGNLDQNVDLPPLVTALSRIPHHIERQHVCLQSWKKSGFYVIAVNTGEEIKDLKSIYPEVDLWVREDKTSTLYKKQTQRIWRLCQEAKHLKRPVFIINSDIEIDGDLNIFTSKLDYAEKNVVFGIRWNYDDDKKYSYKEKWGIDGFLITPEMAESLPDLGYRIGCAMWDYWLPFHFYLQDYTFSPIGEQFFFHKTHQIFWSRKEWQFGLSLVKNNYPKEDYNIISVRGGVNLRNALGDSSERIQTLVFDHIPKCGGSSVRNFLKGEDADNFKHPYPNLAFKKEESYLIHFKDRKVGDLSPIEKFKELPQKFRYAYRYVSGHDVSQLINYCHPDSFLFCTIRDPVELNISHLKYIYADERHPLHKDITSRSLESFIKENKLILDVLSHRFCVEHPRDIKKRNRWSWDEIKQNPEKALEVIRKNIQTYDYIEHHDNISRLTKTLRLVVPNSLQCYSKTNDFSSNSIKSWIDSGCKKLELTPEDIDLITEQCKIDVETYKICLEEMQRINKKTFLKYYNNLNEWTYTVFDDKETSLQNLTGEKDTKLWGL